METNDSLNAACFNNLKAAEMLVSLQKSLPTAADSPLSKNDYRQPI